MIQILNRSEVSLEEILSRENPTVNVSDAVTEIISNVRTNGDKALFSYAEKFDHVSLSSLEVTKEEIAEAVSAVDPAFLAILQEAAANIRQFHQQQVRSSFILNEKKGVIMGQKIIPIEKVGLYVPGGTAA